MAGQQRPPIAQTFFNVSLAVQSTPTALAVQLDVTSLVQAFTVCNPSVNTASVFIGDQGVTSSVAGTIGTGVEIVAGTSQTFSVRQDRQFYELQDPALLLAQKELCQVLQPILIPVIVWQPNNIYLIATAAAAPVTVSIMMFRNVYI